MIVLKIGGSLHGSEYLSQWIDQLAAVKHQKIIIVPGGGPFANHVREIEQEAQLSLERSHDMAVMAMQQFGKLLHEMNTSLSLLNNLYDINSYEDGCKIWDPYEMVIKNCPYPKNWQTTSDSLAAWLAMQTEASHLCLIKSGKVNRSTIKNLQSDLVDNYLPTALNNFQGKLHFYHASEASIFDQHLLNDQLN